MAPQEKHPRKPFGPNRRPFGDPIRTLEEDSGPRRQSDNQALCKCAPVLEGAGEGEVRGGAAAGLAAQRGEGVEAAEGLECGSKEGEAVGEAVGEDGSGCTAKA